MNIRTLAASVLALGLMAPVAMAAGGPAGSEVNNRISDYGNVELATSSTKAFSAVVVTKVKRGSIGNFIDETAEEKNNRSSK